MRKGLFLTISKIMFSIVRMNIVDKLFIMMDKIEIMMDKIEIIVIKCEVVK